MPDFASVEVIQHLISLLFALLLAVIALACAFRAKFFSLPIHTPQKEPPTSVGGSQVSLGGDRSISQAFPHLQVGVQVISVADCLRLFVLFMILQFLILPLFLQWSFLFKEGPLDANYTGWLNLVAMAALTFILSLFFFRQRKQVKLLF